MSAAGPASGHEAGRLGCARQAAGRAAGVHTCAFFSRAPSPAILSMNQRCTSAGAPWALLDTHGGKGRPERGEGRSRQRHQGGGLMGRPAFKLRWIVCSSGGKQSID
jgi:hypothetical protein